MVTKHCESPFDQAAVTNAAAYLAIRLPRGRQIVILDAIQRSIVLISKRKEGSSSGSGSSSHTQGSRIAAVIQSEVVLMPDKSPHCAEEARQSRKSD